MGVNRVKPRAASCAICAACRLLWAAAICCFPLLVLAGGHLRPNSPGERYVRALTACDPTHAWLACCAVVLAAPRLSDDVADDTPVAYSLNARAGRQNDAWCTMMHWEVACAGCGQLCVPWGCPSSNDCPADTPVACSHRNCTPRTCRAPLAPLYRHAPGACCLLGPPVGVWLALQPLD